MPRYLTQQALAYLMRQSAEALAERMQGKVRVSFQLLRPLNSLV